MSIVRAAFGHYDAVGNPDEADVIIGHSFGTRTGEGSPNRSIAEFTIVHSDGRPILADRTLVNAFPNRDEQVDHVVEGPTSNIVGQGVGAWGTLVEAKKFMNQEGLGNALMVGHAYHIGRILMQAKKLGIRSIVPANLPRDFDPESEQLWTRWPSMWVPREVIGSLVLRLQGKL
jgi:hypothetical protein